MNKIPQHVGIILDGNRRWAKERGLPALEGHHRGLDNLETVGKAVFNRGIKVLTVYSLSYENYLEREQAELDYLYDLFREALEKSLPKFHEDNIRMHFVGRIGWMPEDIRRKAREAEEETRANTRGVFVITMIYGGRDEIVRAVREASARFPASAISEDLISDHLDTAFLPKELRDIDLVIRAGGRQRSSNFFIWQTVYADWYFLEKFWPDFTEEDLDKALAWYAEQQRNFGK